VQRLGIKVIRIWGFNDKLPSAPGVYDEGQFHGLDQVIAAAGEKDIRLIIAIGNLWPHYKGPENWLAWGEGSAAGKTILDFYK
jgi:mannan endo-1,4-beta-mannosidase